MTEPCGTKGLRHVCNREAGHDGLHWQVDSNGVMVFGTADRPLTTHLPTQSTVSEDEPI